MWCWRHLCTGPVAHQPAVAARLAARGRRGGMAACIRMGCSGPHTRDTARPPAAGPRGAAGPPGMHPLRGALPRQRRMRLIVVHALVSHWGPAAGRCHMVSLERGGLDQHHGKHCWQSWSCQSADESNTITIAGFAERRSAMYDAWKNCSLLDDDGLASHRAPPYLLNVFIHRMPERSAEPCATNNLHDFNSPRFSSFDLQRGTYVN